MSLLSQVTGVEPVITYAKKATVIPQRRPMFWLALAGATAAIVVLFVRGGR